MVSEISTGTMKNKQYWVMTDARTGTGEASNARIIHSGTSHEVTFNVDAVAGKVAITVKKTATAHNGVQPAAMDTGADSKKEVVMRKP